MAKLGCALILIIGLAAAVTSGLSSLGMRSPTDSFRTAKLVRGDIEHTVASTGTVKPVRSVTIGSFVSGPVSEILVDYNDRVTAGQLMARIDPRLYTATVARDRANLETQRAEVARVEAQLQQAKNDEARSLQLQQRNRDFISASEIDQYRFARMALEAQLTVAEAAVKQAEASLDNSITNEGYTEIRSPVDGIVIERKVDPGQTLASQFNTPEMFIVAPDMDKLMHVFASVDEADIGLVRAARERNLPVSFTVDAYPDEVFSGTIHQVRTNSTTTENVVTYPVVIAAPNTELKLLPGMTATISFQVDIRHDVIKIPNEALLFLPKHGQVRGEDQKLLQPFHAPRGGNVLATADRDQRHVWVRDGEKLRAVSIRTGISDGVFTELVEGELNEGDEVVTGMNLGLPGE